MNGFLRLAIAMAVAMAVPLVASGCKRNPTPIDASGGTDAASSTDAGPDTDGGPGPSDAGMVIQEVGDFPGTIGAITTSLSLTGAREVNGSISPVGDEDFIAIDGPAGEAVVLDIVPAAGSSLDPDLQAMTLFGLIINYNGTGPAPPGAHLELVIPAPGSFALSIAGQSGTSGAYVLVLSAGTYAPAVTAPLPDDGLIMMAATKTVPGSTLYFEVPTTMTSKCVTVDAVSTGTIETYLYVLDIGFEPDFTSDDSGPSPFPPVSFAHPVAGMDTTLRLAVQDYSGTAATTHTFDLVVSSTTATPPCP